MKNTMTKSTLSHLIKALIVILIVAGSIQGLTEVYWRMALKPRLDKHASQNIATFLKTRNSGFKNQMNYIWHRYKESRDASREGLYAILDPFLKITDFDGNLYILGIEMTFDYDIFDNKDGEVVIKRGDTEEDQGKPKIKSRWTFVFNGGPEVRATIDYYLNEDLFDTSQLQADLRRRTFTQSWLATAVVLLLAGMWYLFQIRVDRLKKKQADDLARAHINAELKAAQQIQSSMIPTGSHDLGTYLLSGDCKPASEVGGDYFDFHLLDDGRLIVVIGDVSGHGLSAGILVSMAKSAFITTTDHYQEEDFQNILMAFNKVIRRSTSGKTLLMTFCYLILDPERGIIGCSVNGHPFPLVADSEGNITEITTVGGYPLGVREKQDFRIIESSFGVGDTLLLYTDGLPEQVNIEGEPWGYECFANRFSELIKEKDHASIVNSMIASAMNHAGEAEQEDDMTMLIIRYRGVKKHTN